LNGKKVFLGHKVKNCTIWADEATWTGFFQYKLIKADKTFQKASKQNKNLFRLLLGGIGANNSETTEELEVSSLGPQKNKNSRKIRGDLG